MANLYIVVEDEGANSFRVVSDSIEDAIAWHKQHYPNSTVTEVFERVWTEDDGEEER